VLGRIEHRRLPAFDHVLWAANGMRGINRIGGDVKRLDIGELADAMLLNPGDKGAHGPVIGHARVSVANLGGEKFEETARGMVANLGDHRGHGDVPCAINIFAGTTSYRVRQLSA
jgi:hypothetical protein